MESRAQGNLPGAGGIPLREEGAGAAAAKTDGTSVADTGVLVGNKDRQVVPLGGASAAPPSKDARRHPHPWETPHERYYKGAFLWKRRWKEALDGMEASLKEGRGKGRGGEYGLGGNEDKKDNSLPPVVPVEWLRAGGSPSERMQAAQAREKETQAAGETGPRAE